MLKSNIDIGDTAISMIMGSNVGGSRFDVADLVIDELLCSGNKILYIVTDGDIDDLSIGVNHPNVTIVEFNIDSEIISYCNSLDSEAYDYIYIQTLGNVIMNKTIHMYDASWVSFCNELRLSEIKCIIGINCVVSDYAIETYNKLCDSLFSITEAYNVIYGNILNSFSVYVNNAYLSTTSQLEGSLKSRIRDNKLLNLLG